MRRETGEGNCHWQRRHRRLLWVGLGVAVAAAVACIGFSTDTGPGPVSARQSESRSRTRAKRFIARTRHLLGALSARVPPAIVRPEVGEPIEREELAQLLEEYQSKFCANYEIEVARLPDAESALDMARTRASAEKDEMLAALSVDGVARTASTSALAYLAERSAVDRDRACAAYALVDLLRVVPEAEPGSYLAQIARDPPSGSILLRSAAIDAMGQTGRADYVREVDGYVVPGTDSRVLVSAVEASTTIVGDAEVASKLLSDDFVVDEQLAGGLPHALSVGAGPRLVEVVSSLASASEPKRRLAALRAASLGSGLPDALPAIVEAARAPTTTREEASRIVESIQNTSGDGAPAQLMNLARDRGISPMMRGISLLAARPGRDAEGVARQIAGATRDVSLALSLARAAHGADPNLANRILDAFARDRELETALVRALTAPRSSTLRDLAASYLERNTSDPGP